MEMIMNWENCHVYSPTGHEIRPRARIWSSKEQPPTLHTSWHIFISLRLIKKLLLSKRRYHCHVNLHTCLSNPDRWHVNIQNNLTSTWLLKHVHFVHINSIIKIVSMSFHDVGIRIQTSANCGHVNKMAAS